jgi:hypothetical protein
VDDNGNTVLSVDQLARETINFIVGTPDFYVRELPGGLTDEEKVGVIQPLVRPGVLRLAPQRPTCMRTAPGVFSGGRSI